MPDKKIIAVAGATGAQGGGLVRAIQQDTAGPFRARALTRDPNSAKAQELAKLGAEVVEANVDDEESVKKAFKGATAAFCVTFYWDHMSPEREKAQARALANAAKAAGLEHVIWSTLEDSRKSIPLSDSRMPILMEKYKVPHFDAKAEADAYFAGLPVTYLLTSFYWENFIYFGMGPQKMPDGGLAIALPLGQKKLPSIAVADIGKCAFSILKRGGEFRGKTVGIAGEHLSGAEMAAGFSKALGREVRYQELEPEVYRGFGFPGADDLGNMFQFNRDFDELFRGHRDIAFSRSINPELQTFEGWLAQNKSRIPMPE